MLKIRRSSVKFTESPQMVSSLRPYMSTIYMSMWAPPFTYTLMFAGFQTVNKANVA